MTHVTVRVREVSAARSSPAGRRTGRRLAVHFLDVPSDAALIQTPDGANVLVDCSDQVEDGEKVVRYLTSRNVTHLHALVASHQHADHVRGFIAVFDAIRARDLTADRYVESGEDPKERWYRDVKKAFGLIPESRRPELVPVTTSQALPVPSATTFHIYTDTRYSLKDRDYRSLWLKVTHGVATFLLPGDNKRHQEKHMVADYGGSLHADVFKASEHGSEHGSGDDVLAAAQPQIVIVSNEGHEDDPTPETLRRLRGDAATRRRVYQTREDGRIVITTDGRRRGDGLRYLVETG